MASNIRLKNVTVAEKYYLDITVEFNWAFLFSHSEARVREDNCTSCVATDKWCSLQNLGGLSNLNFLLLDVMQ